jgi:hypothetical protein
MAEKQKNRKQGRNKKSGHNARYINERRHEKSHVRRITKHLIKFPGDTASALALKLYQIRAGIIAAK